MKKKYRFFKNWNLLKLYTCELIVVDTTADKGSKSQVRTLYVKTTNALFIYINNKRVSLNTIYKIAPLENNNFITIKIQGIFNSKIIKILCPKLEVNIIKQSFSKAKSLDIRPILTKNIVLNNNRKIWQREMILHKVQKREKLLFTKPFKFIPNNQTLKTINNN
ncbi:hypothetical protein D9O36_13805 [Zobellia amurskyensis]|uniref:Uncharacterized protein n=1 Tax=Zobellia amurskyensis TaxID=248905 RepID=A0A7X2ZV04_9FLAO|nr:hypothetical protein [Zobellia amurskyensis]MUH36923.1 hypothetical protein [Zobellia amurskyensis]